MIDRELVTRKINLIAPDLSDLEKIAASGIEAFRGKRESQALAERYLERIIGRMIDINFHLVTEGGAPPPKDYFQSFTAMSDGILPPEFAHSIASCAGLRNRIAHEYDVIDQTLLFEGLTAAVRDIPVYLKHILTFLEAKG